MPVEINELVVRAVVQGQGAPSVTGALSAKEKEDLVQACVKEILKVLRSSKER